MSNLCDVDTFLTVFVRVSVGVGPTIWVPIIVEAGIELGAEAEESRESRTTRYNCQE
jgi:hypothetical protein